MTVGSLLNKRLGQSIKKGNKVEKIGNNVVLEYEEMDFGDKDFQKLI